MTPTPTKAQRQATQGDLDRCTAITVSQQSQIARLTGERDLLREFARQFAIHHDFRPGSELMRWAGPIDDLWEAWRDVEFTCLNPDDPREPVEGATT